MTARRQGRTGYLVRPLAQREQRHRRAALIGLGVLIILGTSPVMGHHLFSPTEVLLAGRDHLFNVCLVALHMLFAPVHDVFHVLLAGGLLVGLGVRLRSALRLRGTLAALGATPPRQGSLFWAVAVKAGVPPHNVRVVRGLPVPAFTAGWWRPRIYVAAELESSLGTDELVAVMAHEGAHARRRDPARASVLRFLADTLFYIPALRRLADDIADEAEIAADDHAASISSTSPAAVASAIVSLASWGDRAGMNGIRAPIPASVVGFASPALFERRVRRLIGEDVAVGTHVTRRSIGSAALVLALVLVSGLIMSHPIADADSPGTLAKHCRHHHGFAGAHLFCLGMHHSATAGVNCPHAHQT